MKENKRYIFLKKSYFKHLNNFSFKATNSINTDNISVYEDNLNQGINK